MLEVNESKEGVVALHLPIGPLKTRSGWSRYRDANPVLNDNIRAGMCDIEICIFLNSSQ